MIVVMKPHAPDAAIEAVISFLVSAGFDVHRSSGHERTILGVVGDVTGDDVGVISELEGVTQVVRVSEPYRLAARGVTGAIRVVSGEFGTIGGPRPWIAIEPVSGNDRHSTATFLQGPSLVGRGFDAAVSRISGAPGNIGGLFRISLTAVSDPPLALFVERPSGSRLETWMQAAEAWLERRSDVVLLEAGDEQPNGARSLDVVALSRARERTSLPIVVDVPRIAGMGRRTAAVACAALGAGVDGLILRVRIGRDDDQPRVPGSLTLADATALAGRLRALAAVLHA
jgi:3-deoxy-7-phosphoheptulonate synthase